jgi:hypothetical protein
VKTQVFMLVPYDVPPGEIGDFERLLLERHRFDPDEPGSRGRYDYLVGALEKSLNDPVAEGRLPPKVFIRAEAARQESPLSPFFLTVPACGAVSGFRIRAPLPSGRLLGRRARKFPEASFGVSGLREVQSLHRCIRCTAMYCTATCCNAGWSGWLQ